MIMPGSVFEKLKNGYAVYWRIMDRSYFAYINRRGDVIAYECDSLDFLKSIIRSIDYIPAKGLCVFTEGGVKCFEGRGFTGAEAAGLIWGP